MIFEKFDFPLPSKGEIKVVKEIAESNPEFLDGEKCGFCKTLWRAIPNEYRKSTLSTGF